MVNAAYLAGRIMLAILFVLAGVNKVMDPAGTAEFIESSSILPGILALPTGLFELVAGVLLAIGIYVRVIAPVLAGFTILTIAFFHYNLADQLQMTLALKNLAISGGLLAVFAHEEGKAA